MTQKSAKKLGTTGVSSLRQQRAEPVQANAAVKRERSTCEHIGTQEIYALTVKWP
jgi:hypothetical protein